jgi:hypothetical protein
MCDTNYDYNYEIPKEEIKREEPTSVTLRELFDYDKITKSYTKFDCRARSSSKLLYRIPEHQRFPQWNKEQKLGLIDTVFRNYTMSGIVLSEKKVMKNGKMENYYDIEDGQTRLSILQDFHACRFALSNDLTFDDLDLEDQKRFLDYNITKEIIQNNSRTLEDYDNHIHEMFERLQGGKRLTDVDKYWNRSKSPLVKFAISIIKTYGNDFNIKNFSDKKRKGLTNICGLIGGFLYGSNNNKMGYSPAFRHQIHNLNKEITNSQRDSVINFIKYYISIKNDSYSIIPKNKDEKDLDFKNNAKYINMIMLDYKDHTNNKKIWIDYFILSRHNPNFSTGTCSIYNNLTKANKQNNSEENIRVRLNRVKEFYRDKEGTAEEHGIVYTNIEY